MHDINGRVPAPLAGDWLAIGRRIALPVYMLVMLSLALAACSSRTRSTPASTPVISAQPPTAVIASLTAEPTEIPATPTAQVYFTPSPTPNYPQPAFPITGMEISRINIREINLAAQAGAYWIRRNALLWMDVEPIEGDRRWEAVSDLEQELKDAANSRLQVILVVRGTPNWAQKVPGMYCSAVSDAKLSAFARFMADAVSRYSQPPYNVHYWEIYNEPDVDPGLVPSDYPFGCWGDNYDSYYGGGYYAEMLRQVYPQMKSVNENIQILSGGLNLDCDPDRPPQGKDCLPARYMEGILKNGGGDFFDGVSFHAYDYYSEPFIYSNYNWTTSRSTTGPVLVTKAHFLRQVLDAYGYTDKFLINTEVGLLCGRDKPEPQCETEEFHLTKAYYAVQVNTAALVEGLRGTVWFTLRGWRNSGLVTPGLIPHPVYYAYQFSAVMLNGSAFVRHLDEFPGITGYEFYRDGRYWWLLWSTDPYTPIDIQLPALPGYVFDVFGKTLAPSREMTITQAPVYLDWSPQ